MTDKQPRALVLADALAWNESREAEQAADELRRLHAENEALRHANARYGQREDWWNRRMFDMEQRYMSLVKSVADGLALQVPNITLTTASADEALLRQALEALECHADLGIKADKAITAIKERLDGVR